MAGLSGYAIGAAALAVLAGGIYLLAPNGSPDEAQPVEAALEAPDPTEEAPEPTEAPRTASEGDGSQAPETGTDRVPKRLRGSPAKRRTGAIAHEALKRTGAIPAAQYGAGQILEPETPPPDTCRRPECTAGEGSHGPRSAHSRSPRDRTSAGAEPDAADAS